MKVHQTGRAKENYNYYNFRIIQQQYKPHSAWQYMYMLAT